MSTANDNDSVGPNSPSVSSANALAPAVAAGDVPAPTVATGVPFFIGTSSLPNYRGEPHTLTAFREKIIRILELVSLSPTQQVQLLLGQLNGPAAEEVRSWPATEKTSVQQVLDRLKKEFEVQSPTEVRLKFYDRRQRPGESLREYALALQSAYRALQQVDTIDPLAAESIITDRFVEGVDSRMVQSQLRMLAAQNPGMPFLDFKTLALRVVGTDSPCTSYMQPPYSPDLAGGVPSIAPLSSASSVQAVQAAQTTTPANTTVTPDTLARVVDSLCQVLKELKGHSTPSSRESSVSRTVTPEPVHDHPNPDRPPPQRFASQERPYCTYCRRHGHYRSRCFQLNGLPLSPRAVTQEVEPQAQRNRNGSQGSFRNVRM